MGSIEKLLFREAIRRRLAATVEGEVPTPDEPVTPVPPQEAPTPADPDPGTPGDPAQPATVPPPNEPAEPIAPDPDERARRIMALV